jgi:hypothetical protein
MSELPRQIDRRVRREIAALPRPWRVVKKRDHYFLFVDSHPVICVGNNSSKCNDWQVAKTLENIRKLCAIC